MKVVVDTNIYVSEALFDAVAEVVVKATLEGAFYIYVSEYILSELYTVLIRLESVAPQLEMERAFRR